MGEEFFSVPLCELLTWAYARNTKTMIPSYNRGDKYLGTDLFLAKKQETNL